MLFKIESETNHTPIQQTVIKFKTLVRLKNHNAKLTSKISAADKDIP